MEITLIILALAATLHFVYDGIILPSIRMYFRNQLFELRDELRAHNIEKGNGCDPLVFSFIHDGINHFLNRLHILTIQFQHELQKELSADEKFKERVQRRNTLIAECTDPDLQRIYKETSRVLEMAFIANAGGWMFYIIPIALVVIFLRELSQQATDTISVAADSVIRKIEDHTLKAA